MRSASQSLLFVGVQGLAVELEEFVDLAEEELGVRVDLLVADDLPHRGLARGIADARRAAAHEHDDLVPGLVEVAHREIGDHVADMERGARRIAAFVEGDRALVHRLGQALDIGALLDEASFLERSKSRVHAFLRIGGII